MSEQERKRYQILRATSGMHTHNTLLMFSKPVKKVVRHGSRLITPLFLHNPRTHKSKTDLRLENY